MARPKRPPQIIGWREKIALPELGVAAMPAKVDTGARTSALHAADIETFHVDGADWVRFRVISSDADDRIAEAPIVDERAIRNTSGIPELRLVIRVALVLGAHRWHVETSLADRERMEFDLILGRTALRGRRIVVHPGRSWLAGPPMADETGD